MSSVILTNEIMMFMAIIVVLLLIVIIWLMLARNKQDQKLISLCDSINQQNMARTAAEVPNGAKEVKQPRGSPKWHRVLSKTSRQRQKRGFKFRISASLRERQNNANQLDSYHENGVPPGIAADSTEENASEQYSQPQENCEMCTQTSGLRGLNSADQHLSESKTSRSSVSVQTDEKHVEDRCEKTSSQKRQKLEIITDNTGLEEKNDEEEDLRRQGGSSPALIADNSGCEVTISSETYSEREEKQAQISLPNRDVELSSDSYLDVDPEERDAKAQPVTVHATVDCLEKRGDDDEGRGINVEISTNGHDFKGNDNEERVDGQEGKGSCHEKRGDVPEERGNEEEERGESQIENLPNQDSAASDDSSDLDYISDEEHEGRDPYQVQVSDPEERNTKAQPVTVHATVDCLEKSGVDGLGREVSGKISKKCHDFKGNGDEERGDDHEERRGNNDKERDSSHEDRGNNYKDTRDGHEEKGDDLKDEGNDDEGIGGGHEKSGNNDDDDDDYEGAHCHEKKVNDNEERANGQEGKGSYPEKREDGSEERGNEEKKRGESRIENLPDQENAASEDDSTKGPGCLTQISVKNGAPSITVENCRQADETDGQCQILLVQCTGTHCKVIKIDPEEGNERKRGESQIENLPDQDNATSEEDSSDLGYISDKEREGRDLDEVQVSGEEDLSESEDDSTKGPGSLTQISVEEGDVNITVEKCRQADETESDETDVQCQLLLVQRTGSHCKVIKTDPEERNTKAQPVTVHATVDCLEKSGVDGLGREVSGKISKKCHDFKGNGDEERGDDHEERRGNNDKERDSSHEDRGNNYKDTRDGHEEKGDDLKDEGNDDEGIGGGHEKSGNNDDDDDDYEGAHCHEKKVNDNEERANGQEGKGSYPEKREDGSEERGNEEKKRGESRIENLPDQENAASEDDSTKGPGCLTQISVKNGAPSITVENCRQADETDGQCQILLVQCTGTHCKVIKKDRNGWKTEEFIQLSEKSRPRCYISNEVVVQIGEENTFIDADGGFTLILKSFKCLKGKVLLSHRVLKHLDKRRKQNPADIAKKIRDCHGVPEIRYLEPDEAETVSDRSDKDKREFESTSNFVNSLLFYKHRESLENIFRLLDANCVIATSDGCLLLESNKPEKLKSMIYSSDFVRKEILLLLRKEDIFNGLQMLQSDITFAINM